MNSYPHKTSFYLTFFFFFLFVLLLAQFYRLQIIEHEKWEKRANQQHEFTIKQPAKRGVFYSKILKPNQHDTYQPLVFDVPFYHLYIDPLNLPEIHKQDLIKYLRSFFCLQEKEKEKFSSHFYKNNHSRKVRSWIDRESHEKILKWWLSFARAKKIPLNALYFIEDFKRSYPFGAMLGQVLHTVREDKEEKTGEVIPTGGLEMVLNDYLLGKSGKKTLLRSPRNTMETGYLPLEPEPGADVYLTIDATIQTIVEEELQAAVKKTKAKFGWAIMMDPFTGNILALAQYPFFNPTFYRDYFNSPDLLAHTKVRAITDPFEPGSTMKPITMLVALLANEELQKRGKPPLFSPQEKINTSSGVFPGRTNKPIKDLSHHRYLNMYMGIQKSSNIYMGRVVQRIIETLGDEWYHDTLEKIFGFGLKTGIELPSESPGYLPNPRKKKERAGTEWVTATPYSLAMGYNLLVNALHMLKAYAFLANGGYLITPHIVEKISQKKGEKEEILYTFSEGKKEPIVSRPLIQEVIKAMKFTTKTGGTATLAEIPGYTEVGKTSSTEKVVKGTYSKQTHFSTFAGFAPVSQPRFVLLIGIDEPEYKYIPGVGKNHMGGYSSAPVFKKAGLRVLRYLEVNPDDPYGYPAGDPRTDPEKADWIKETAQLKQLYESWNKN